MDREYCELGVRQGWLELEDIITRGDEKEYRYRYLDTYGVE